MCNNQAQIRCCYRLHPEETIRDIELAYDEGLVNPSTIGFDEIEEQLGRSKQSVLDELRNDKHYQLINDTIKELEWWVCFDQKENKRIEVSAFAERVDSEQTSIKNVRSESYRVEVKVGRNDPCPCGSGKKYKKCCGQNV